MILLDVYILLGLFILLSVAVFLVVPNCHVCIPKYLQRLVIVVESKVDHKYCSFLEGY